MIAHVHGGAVGRAPEIVHGSTSEIHHDGAGVFRGLPDPFPATRYHSLAVRPGTVPPDVLDVTARTPDGVIMGLRHRTRPVEGVQFHPESVLSRHGHRLLRNWLSSCGDPRMRGGAGPRRAHRRHRRKISVEIRNVPRRGDEDHIEGFRHCPRVAEALLAS